VIECPYCSRPADSQGAINHEGYCNGLKDAGLIVLQRYALDHRIAQLEEALTKVHGIVAEYWGPCPGSVETLLIVRDVLGTKDWRPNVDFMPRLLTPLETACDHRSTFTGLETVTDGKCELCGQSISETPAEPEDPTRWCNACGAMREQDCKCGPIAENE
jgi:hypothetical protein